MKFAEYDYRDVQGADGCSAMDGVWDAHWRGRQGLKGDLSDEPLWPTIREHLRTPGRLLEAGCGTGQWVQFLGGLGHDAVGIDYAPSGLEVGRAHNPSLNLIQADFRSLPFDDGSFDYVVSFGAVEHDIEGPEDALREFHRVLKPDGKLMCSVPCLNLYRTIGYPLLAIRKWLKCRTMLRRLRGKTAPFVFYEYIWSPKGYQTILSQCGFNVLAMHGYGNVLKSRPTQLLDAIAARVWPLSSAHMMMAICEKGQIA
ncbi:class I SAM-dependent methyltransferase [Anaerobaca lacustris]|uniref:Class I SAM-dependent methyltransferase n=1 Tax=Anaerobaca lacustris TaxID=3044600 RepID=A0AAW6TWQ2_9BACT|nr:class I SAM-dependent methyltransferase [Sedimentisphaerales bacterium M17dextr]